ncbi:DEAD/DEAH box helicase [Hugenholtzia roseola]|uniref:DEAD/DEAH box helicase n=1 Tax=Hugenholtzia roseola TaxID=1002 RepID=UPI000400A504|nr:DEAD/DEAH box helicase [Hugenholtzia roseola]
MAQKPYLCSHLQLISPMTTFQDFKLNRQLLDALAEKGYQTPTPIQIKAIPLLLAGHDLIGVAQTGTGKTAAYLLPLLMKVKYAQGSLPRALILAPTRELVMQIAENAQELSRYTDLRIVPLYGGVGMKAQREAVAAGVDIAVATTGRLLDLYKENAISFKLIQTMVIDEADRMMDMGFLPQIRSLLEVVPSKKRQNALFSATMPEKVTALTQEFLEFPERVEITPPATTAQTIKQGIYETPNFKTKINLLDALLQDKEQFKKVIIFTKTKESANNILKFIHRKIDPNVKVIHSNKDQNARTNAFEEFQKGDLRILVATDVAARGIDISEVSHVINFEVPIQYEDYVHRIGRTGRAEKEGEALTFVHPVEQYHVRKIEKLIKKNIPTLPLPEQVVIEPTPYEEQQEILRQLDYIKQREDPTYQGAFHRKKRRPAPVAKKTKPKNAKSIKNKGAKDTKSKFRKTN